MANEPHADVSTGYSGDMEYFDASPDIHMADWSPAPPGTANPKAEQVHMMIGIGPQHVAVLRFKTAVGVDRFIADLQQHRESVWGAVPQEAGK